MALSPTRRNDAPKEDSALRQQGFGLRPRSMPGKCRQAIEVIDEFHDENTRGELGTGTVCGSAADRVVSEKKHDPDRVRGH